MNTYPQNLKVVGPRRPVVFETIMKEEEEEEDNDSKPKKEPCESTVPECSVKDEQILEKCKLQKDYNSTHGFRSSRNVIGRQAVDCKQNPQDFTEWSSMRTKLKKFTGFEDKPKKKTWTIWTEERKETLGQNERDMEA
ncbi:Protein of unknown function [Gryllus bimaculatus]|nr:Protein of unknown function [Gryllus bimaculatus]